RRRLSSAWRRQRSGATSRRGRRTPTSAFSTTTPAPTGSCVWRTQLADRRRCSSSRSVPHVRRIWCRRRSHDRSSNRRTSYVKHTTSGEAKKQNGSTWLIYGVSGSGKTPLASCMPHPWFWDFESGAASMLRDDVAISQPESYADILGLVQAVDASK